MTDRDLTPEEARAEIEAFMGAGWSSIALIVGADTRLAYTRRFDAGYISVEVEGRGPTYRAAVDALKTAWRDAVRPWVTVAMKDGSMLHLTLKEDSK